jgi:PKD repeat protein
MLTYTSLLRPRLLVATGLAVSALSVLAGPALATNGPQYGSIGQYGEVFRGGGFDNCWFDQGNYDGKGCNTTEQQPLPGKFVDPVGFTVDNNDPDPSGTSTAEYVLDRTSDLPANVQAAASGPDKATATTSWRIQKLSSTGTVEGVDEFSLPADTPSSETNGITNDEMFGLAVDPTSGTVYSLLVGYDTNTGNEVVQEILSWSTAQSGMNNNTSEQELIPATSTFDTISAGLDSYPTPSVLSTQSDLTASGSSLAFNGNPDIENPTGIAIDSTGGTDYVAVQGDDPTTNAYGAGIVTISPTTGAIANNWSGGEFAGLSNDFADEVEPGAGLSTDPTNGSLTWLDNRLTGTNTPEDFDVASVPSNLTSSPTVLVSPSNGVTHPDLNTLDLDDAPVATADVPPESYDDGTPNAATATSSPQIVALSNGLYAGVFEPEPAGSADPSNPADQDGEYTPVDPGIRLLQPDGNGLLSESTPPLLTLFDTLGNPTVNTSGSTTTASACNLSDQTSTTNNAPSFPSLAAGSGGAIWVLTNGQDTSDDGQGVSGTSGSGKLEGGRELIELAPGATAACPSPSGSFTLSGGGNTVNAGTTLTVTDGTPVSFDASGISYPGPTASAPSAARAAYEWNFGDGNTSNTLEASSSPFTWPSATSSEQYTSLGDHTVTLTLYGDYGQYVETGTVDVLPTTLADAAFTFSPTSPQAGQSVTFNGSGSTPSTGATITQYEWNFGDGQTANTSTASETHTYSTPGTYTASLKVFDTNSDTSTAKTEQITVAAATTTTTTTTTNTSPPSNKFSISSLKGQKNGSITAKLAFPDPGKAKIVATFKAKVKVKSGKKTKTKTETITFVSGSKSVSAGSVTLSLTPSSKAKSVLKALSSKSSISVSVSITFTPTGGSAAKKSGTAHVPGLAKSKKKK